MLNYADAAIHLQNVEVVCGSNELDPTPSPAFSANVIEFIARISKELFSLGKCREYPDLAAVAFWCRKSNLEKLYTQAFKYRLGWGLCFHIAPGNIPLNFMFSFLFGLIAGNANIVRMPGRAFPQNDFVCQVINKILPEYPEIHQRTSIIRYPRDTRITAELSGQADARMIWGGDGTVGSIRALPVKPSCIDICFIDRFSFAILNGGAILAASDTELKTLAKNFYNDVFLMDQNACSSPRLIVWECDSEEARNRFWKYVRNEVASAYALAAESVIGKLTVACTDCINNPDILRWSASDNFIYHMELDRLSVHEMENNGKCGYFYEYSLKKWDELLPVCGKKCQTITYFGINADELRIFLINKHVKGVDRIVPVGQALNINTNWDGYK